MALNSPPGGKIVITASSAGLYALPPIPQYTASKYALVGLTRALAPVADKVGVCVNAICPAIVATGLAPPGLMDAFEERVRTPMSTIMRAFDTLGVLDIEERDKDGEAGVDGLVGSDGLTGDRKPARNLNGMIVECSLDNLYFRNEVDKADDSQKFMAQSELFFLPFSHPFLSLSVLCLRCLEQVRLMLGPLRILNAIRNSLCRVKHGRHE